MLAYLLTKTRHNIVITTNFDHLIEDAVHYYMQNMPLVIGHESLAHYITPKTNRVEIIKIHRDLLFDPANRVSEVESLHDNWKKALRAILSEYSPIFIGYAGNDNSLMDFLIENDEAFARGELMCPYWLLYENDIVEGQIETFLNRSKGYCIKHKGFDDVMHLIATTFDYILPLEEDFIRDAKNRFDLLAEAVETFESKLKKDKEEDLKKLEVISEGDMQEKTNNVEIHEMEQRAYRFLILRAYENAYENFAELVRLNSKNARYRSALGITLSAMKRYEEALTEKRKAVELDPQNARYYSSLGITLHALKSYEEALLECRRAVELEPENAGYHNNLGTTLHALKSYEEALLVYRRAVELEPENAGYCNRLKRTLRKMEHL